MIHVMGLLTYTYIQQCAHIGIKGPLCLRGRKKGDGKNYSIIKTANQTDLHAHAERNRIQRLCARAKNYNQIKIYSQC